MLSIRVLMALTLVAASVASAAAPAGNAAAGKPLYAVCIACHGANGEGNQALNAPRLAGQEAWYMTRQILNFQQGIRGTGRGDIYGAQMKPMAATLRDAAAVANVAAHIQTLRPPAARLSVRGDAARGRTLYATCAACHGPNGQGIQAMNAPRLVGTSDWYMVTQLRNYRSGARGSHAKDTFGRQMAPMAKTLTDDKAINDVVAYIATLR